MTDIAGTDLVDEISTYQDRILKVMMNGTIMDKIYKDQREAGAYQFKDYLNDLFHVVWKPLNGLNDMQVRTRRLLRAQLCRPVEYTLEPCSER